MITDSLHFNHEFTDNPGSGTLQFTLEQIKDGPVQNCLILLWRSGPFLAKFVLRPRGFEPCERSAE